jgi:hypothetical protein
MDIGRKSNIVKISYRDGKIVKKLSLNLNNEHDALFYESYQRLPLDNRNYMAALYASEQERGVNDATGHRVQELALSNPKEDTVIMREKRNAELESLKESKAYYENKIKEIEANAMGAELNASEKAEKEECKKKIDEIKRKIRNLDATWTKALNSEIFKTGHLSGLNPLTRDALKESLDKVADSMSKDVVAFLEDKFEQLPARADGEDGSEQYVMTNAAYLAAMCRHLGFDDVSKLRDAIKRFYGLLHSITRDTLTQDAYANNYASHVDDIIDLMGIIDDIEVPNYLNRGKADVIVEQLKPVAVSIKFALGRAAYKTYTEADKRHLPNWNAIKAILDGSTFKEFVAIGDEENTFRETRKFQNAERPYAVLSAAITDAVEAIYDDWQKVPRIRVKHRNNQSYDKFITKINELSDAVFIGRASYIRKGNTRASQQDVVELTTEFELADNTLKVTAFKAIDTKFEEALHGIEFPDWLHIPDYDRSRYTYVYQPPTIDKDGFVSTVTNAILSQLKLAKDGELPADIMRKLVSRGSGAQYRALDSPDQQFHNIIDMGNPLKAIRSKRRL